MKSSVIVAFLALAASPCAAGDDQFLDITIGSPLEIPQCALWQSPIQRDYEDPYPSYAIQQAYLPCYQQRTTKPKPGTPLTMIGHEHVSVRFAEGRVPRGIREVFITLSNGRVRQIQVWTAGLSWQDQMLELLTSKYGKPSRIASEAKANLMGATFHGIVAKWKRQDLTVEFAGIYDSTTLGMITITKPSVPEVKAQETEQGF